MTEADWKELGRYVRWCADEIGLRDWAIELERKEPPRPEAMAHTEAIGGRKMAYIRFRDDFRESSPEDQRNTVVHELLHCHLFFAEQVMIDEMESVAPRCTYDVLCSTVHRHIEYSCDGIATAIDKHFPLIKWPKPRGAKKRKRR